MKEEGKKKQSIIYYVWVVILLDTYTKHLVEQYETRRIWKHFVFFKKKNLVKQFYSNLLVEKKKKKKLSSNKIIN